MEPELTLNDSYRVVLYMCLDSVCRLRSYRGKGFFGVCGLVGGGVFFFYKQTRQEETCVFTFWHKDMKDPCGAGALVTPLSDCHYNAGIIKINAFSVKPYRDIFHKTRATPTPQETRVKVHRKLGGCHFSLPLLLLTFNVRC